MARTALTPQVVTRTGITPSFAAANVDGHSVPNNGHRALRIKNSGSETTLTVKVGKTIDGQTAAGKTVTIPATTGDVITGFWPVGDYNQPDGSIHIDYTVTTGVTIAVLDF